MPKILPDGQAWVHLDLTRTTLQFGSEDAVRGLLPMLLDLLEREVPQIGHLLATDDMQAVKVSLHTLKGCVPLFCTPALSEHLNRADHLSKTASSAEMVEVFSVLGPQLMHLKQEAQQYLS